MYIEVFFHVHLFTVMLSSITLKVTTAQFTLSGSVLTLFSTPVPLISLSCFIVTFESPFKKKKKKKKVILIRGSHFNKRHNLIEEMWVRTVAWALLVCSNVFRSPRLKRCVFQAEPYTVHQLAGHYSLYCMRDVF